MKKLPIVILLLWLCAGCQTTIPENDTIAPEAGVNFTSDKAHCNYNSPNSTAPNNNCTGYFSNTDPIAFVVSGKDAGGVKELAVTVPLELPSSNVTVNEGATLTSRNTGGAIIYTATGNRDQPLNTITISGTINPLGRNSTPEVFVTVTDFGGRSGTPNVTNYTTTLAISGP